MVTTPNVSPAKLVRLEFVNRELFENTIRVARKKAGDLRVAFALVARAQFKFQRQIFQLKSRGKYELLKSPASKIRDVGFEFPILLRSGRLAASLLQPGGENILSIGKQRLFYGTAVPYGVFHQEGTSKMPRRPILFIDEQRRRTFRQIILRHVRKGFSKPK